MILSKMFSPADDWGLAPLGSNLPLRVQVQRKTSASGSVTPEEYRRIGRELCALTPEGGAASDV